LQSAESSDFLCNILPALSEHGIFSLKVLHCRWIENVAFSFGCIRSGVLHSSATVIHTFILK